MFATRLKCVFLILLFMISFSAMAETTMISFDEFKQLTPIQKLGKELFYDTNLSSPAGQSCATCHDAKTAFSDPVTSSAVSAGAVTGRVGVRNTPMAKYSAFSPEFYYDETEKAYFGGQFYDGRAANLTEQAKGPFLNPDEMNNATEGEVVAKVEQSSYAELFKQVFGANVFEDDAMAYHYMAEAIAAFENSVIFNLFSSKYDYFLAGLVSLSPKELQGVKIFNSINKGNCNACHTLKTDNDLPPLFTDFSYANLGVPRNADILAVQGEDFIDIGLQQTVDDPKQRGKFKTPSLRNVAVTGPYMHNGVFTSLQEVVEFYNTRDVEPKWQWGQPEIEENMEVMLLGNLGLSDEEVDSLVVFMKTLTDGYGLHELPSYSLTDSVLRLPFLKLEVRSQQTLIYSAEFKLVSEPGGTFFELTSAQVLDEINPGHYVEVPIMFMENDILEIPLLKMFEQQLLGDTYLAQLKLVYQSPMRLQLLYIKKLQ